MEVQANIQIPLIQVLLIQIPLIQVPLTDPILILALVTGILWIAPMLSKVLRLPNIVVLILLGMVFGTNVLGWLQRDSQLILLEKFGLLYIMLVAGIQMDLTNLKQLGRRSLIFGLLTFGFPLCFGLMAGSLLGLSILAACILGLLYSPHVLLAYPILVRFGLAQAEFVGVTVGATVITSFLTLLFFSLIQASALGTLGWLFGLKLTVGLPLLIGLSVWGVPKLGNRMLTQPASDLTQQYVFVLVVLFFISGVTTLLGVDAIVGAFIAGLVLNRSVPLTSPLMKDISFVGNSLFIPIFMISVGVLCDPKIFLSSPKIIVLTGGLVLGSLMGKAIAAGLVGKLFGYPPLEVLVMFSLTMTRAALVLVIALFAQQADLIGDGLFNSAVAYILLTCFLGPLLTEWGAAKIALNDASDVSEGLG